MAHVPYTTVSRVAGVFPTFKRTQAWAPSTAYATGTIISDGTNLQLCSAVTGDATSGSSAPSPWNNALGQATTDHNVTWTMIGLGAPTTQQKPSDADIQSYIQDVSDDIDAVISRRFAEIIATAGGIDAWHASLGTPGLNILEKINKYGAAQQLGEVLSTFGNRAAAELAKVFGGWFQKLWNNLDARDKDGKPLPSGPWDAYFDPEARHETPRPGLLYQAGGDQDPTQVAADVGQSNIFSVHMTL